MLEKYLTWFKAHERAIIVVVVLGFGAHMYGRWIDLQSAKKDAQLTVLTQTVAQDKQNAQQLALAASTAQSQYQQALDAANRLNVQLAQANAQELASLAQRQTVDKALPLPAVAQRIEVLVPGASNGITATTAGVVMNDTASHSVLDALETIPVLGDELKNETQIAKNNEEGLARAVDVIAVQKEQVGALSKSLTDQQAHEAAAVAAEKLNTKKAFRKGFKWGVVTGFIGGLFTYHAIAP